MKKQYAQPRLQKRQPLAAVTAEKKEGSKPIKEDSK
jgi:hypothetical protein